MNVIEFLLRVEKHENWVDSLNDDKSSLDGDNIEKLVISGEKLKKVDLANRTLSNSEMLNSDFLHSKLDGSDFRESNLTGSRFREVSFVGVNFGSANLSSAVLIRANLTTSNLTKSKLTGADLGSANLYNAKIASADLKRISAKHTNFTGARLNGSKVENSNLTNACFKDASVSKVSFKNCLLDEADFRGANLYDTSFLGASMRLTTFDSKEQLRDLRSKLTEEQLQSVLFDDEINYKPEGDETGLLQVILDGKKISPINLSYLLVSLNATYNNLLYMVTTQDSMSEIKRNIRPYYSSTKASDDVYIKQIVKGSIVIELAAYITSGAVILKLIGDLLPKISAEIRGFKALPTKKKRQLEERALELDIQMKEVELQEKQLALEIKRNELQVNNVADVERVHMEHIKDNMDLNKVVESIKFNTDIKHADAESLVKDGAAPLLNVLYKYDGMGMNVKCSYQDNQRKSSNL